MAIALLKCFSGFIIGHLMGKMHKQGAFGFKTGLLLTIPVVLLVCFLIDKIQEL